MSTQNIDLAQSDIEQLYAYIEKYLRKPSPLPPSHPPEPVNPGRAERKEYAKECRQTEIERKYYWEPWMHDRDLLLRLFKLVKRVGVDKLFSEIETISDTGT